MGSSTGRVITIEFGGRILEGDHADQEEQDNINSLPDEIGEIREESENDSLNNGDDGKPEFAGMNERVNHGTPICSRK